MEEEADDDFDADARMEVSAAAASLLKSPTRPSLKAPEVRIGAPPSAQKASAAARRKSLRFVSDDDMEQVRFIPAHNGEPELCGRIAPNDHAIMSGSRKRAPSVKFADASPSPKSAADDEETLRDVVNKIGDVGHTGPIPKLFFATAATTEAATTEASPNAKSSNASKKRRSVSSPVTSGKRRSAVSFAIGQAELVGTPVAGDAGSRSSGFTKRKGTPAPPSMADDNEGDDDEEENDENDENMEDEVDYEVDETENAKPTNVTIVEEEGVIDDEEERGDATMDDTGELNDITAGSDGSGAIPVFRLGDVGNTGPIPHYSPACKASPSAVAVGRGGKKPPLSAIKSAAKSKSPASSAAKSARSRRSSRGITPDADAATPASRASSLAAPANTPATCAGASAKKKAAISASLDGISAAFANIAQTPGGHALRRSVSAVARLLADATTTPGAGTKSALTSPAASIARTIEEDITGAVHFVRVAEERAHQEAAEDAAAALAARCLNDDTMEEEEDAEDFDFDEAFAMDAALAAEGVKDVEVVVDIEKALAAAGAATPEKVQQWLEDNLAEANVADAMEDEEDVEVVAVAAHDTTASTPKSEAAEAAGGASARSKSSVGAKSSKSSR